MQAELPVHLLDICGPRLGVVCPRFRHIVAGKSTLLMATSGRDPVT
jgi:hypothetical protein